MDMHSAAATAPHTWKDVRINDSPCAHCRVCCARWQKLGRHAVDVKHTYQHGNGNQLHYGGAHTSFPGFGCQPECLVPLRTVVKSPPGSRTALYGLAKRNAWIGVPG